MTFHKALMPAYWASYLVNGDDSGLEPEEKEHIDEYLKEEGIAEVVDCSEEAYFSWFCDLYGAKLPGGELLDYTVRYIKCDYSCDESQAEGLRESEDFE